MTGPDPHAVHPLPAFPRIVFLRPLVKSPRIEIGEYTYYDDPDAPERFEERNVTHHYDFIGDRLVIGRFCAIARGARFVMNGANHDLSGLSTYPFNIFGNGWEAGFDIASIEAGFRGDTRVGSDVWIGEEALILPGVSIGHGAVVGARAVVSRDVPPYAVAAGNPAEVRRMRFPEDVVQKLLALAWWDWPVERIAAALPAIRGADVAALETMR